MFARIPALLLLVLAAMLLAVGCGDDDAENGNDGGSGDTTEEPAADDTGTATDDTASAPGGDGATLELGVKGNELEFDTTELTAAAGSVTIRLDNTSTIQHNIAIEDADGTELAAGDLVGDGESSEITVDLEPGTYTYFCSPHKSSGMTGTLTVT